MLTVNRELVLLYWYIGREIFTRQEAQGWGGGKVIEQLARDLQVAFPTMKGFSRSNLMYMRAFHDAWGQNLLLLTKPKSREERLWYAERAVTPGWSRNVMWHHMSTQLQQRTGQAVTNFEKRLPASESELVQQTLKDPYLFDFLGVTADAHEREIETAMTRHITNLLMELGEDKPTLGLLLCKQQHRVVAEYALRGMTQPIGIAEYRLQLPAELAKYLPSIAQIEAELQNGDDQQNRDVS